MMNMACLCLQILLAHEWAVADEEETHDEEDEFGGDFADNEGFDDEEHGGGRGKSNDY